MGPYITFMPLTQRNYPNGWHVPTKYEWLYLKNYLGNKPANKLKEEGTTHWFENNYGTNETGFTALPSGGRWQGGGNFSGLGGLGAWYSSTSIYHSGENLATSISMLHDQSSLWPPNGLWFNNGFSVRCVRDLPAK